MVETKENEIEAKLTDIITDATHAINDRNFALNSHPWSCFANDFRCDATLLDRRTSTTLEEYLNENRLLTDSHPEFSISCKDSEFNFNARYDNMVDFD